MVYNILQNCNFLIRKASAVSQPKYFSQLSYLCKHVFEHLFNATTLYGSSFVRLRLLLNETIKNENCRLKRYIKFCFGS